MSYYSSYYCFFSKVVNCTFFFVLFCFVATVFDLTLFYGIYHKKVMESSCANIIERDHSIILLWILFFASSLSSFVDISSGPKLTRKSIVSVRHVLENWDLFFLRCKGAIKHVYLSGLNPKQIWFEKSKIDLKMRCVQHHTNFVLHTKERAAEKKATTNTKKTTTKTNDFHFFFSNEIKK